jgi:hypothetical protein
MPDNPLHLAIDSAIASNDAIGRSFARLGTTDNPKGFVVTAYNDANNALRLALQGEEPLRMSLAITSSLRSLVSSGIRSEMLNMVAFGQDEANRQLGFYKQARAVVDPMELSEEVNAAVIACEERITSQEALVRAMILTDAEPEIILGDDDKKGVLRASDVTALAAALIASFVWDGFLSVVDWYFSYNGAVAFQKQAVAALDHRTTETCLLCHAQIKPFNTPFELRGRPRYADYMQFPAFHPWCRTSVVLYDARWEDGITRSMVDSANTILAERAAGGSGFRHPVSALA